jgi:hypothetical protein
MPPDASHAEKVAGALQGVAGEVRTLELEGLPAKGDASDWIEQQRREGKAVADVASELLALAGGPATRGEVAAVAGGPALTLLCQIP